MDMNLPLRLLPTLPMIADILTRAGWKCTAAVRDEQRSYRGIRLYHRQPDLQKDVLYLLRPEETHFPVDEYTYLSAVSHGGQADNLICPDRPDEQIMDQLLEIFSAFRSWEDAIDLLVYRNASLQELCELGARLLENPVCIHDDWFIMTAMSAEVERIMPPEYLASSGKGLVPRIILEDFRHDRDYLETYAQRRAEIWKGTAGRDTLYVNLWDGAVYRGRLLVICHERPFRPSDFLLAEVLTQRALLLLQRKQPDIQDTPRSMDDVVYSLIQGKPQDAADLGQLLGMLSWDRRDRFLCIRIRSQQFDAAPVMEHVLHSDLFRVFPGGYILFAGHEQCVILDLDREEGSLALIRSRLAPLCRDYCLYAGISSPVGDIRDLHLAYHQAEVALDRAFRMRSDKWIVLFSECTLEYLLEHLSSPLPPAALAAPELLALRELDRRKGTQYFQTLRTYLLEERDIPRTAEKLIIHRTTLLYRLKKILPMLGTDLDDPWRRLQLLLSLWILDREGNT